MGELSRERLREFRFDKNLLWTLTAFPLRGRWAADCAARMRWRGFIVFYLINQTRHFPPHQSLTRQLPLKGKPWSISTDFIARCPHRAAKPAETLLAPIWKGCKSPHKTDCPYRTRAKLSITEKKAESKFDLDYMPFCDQFLISSVSIHSTCSSGVSIILVWLTISIGIIVSVRTVISAVPPSLNLR